MGRVMAVYDVDPFYADRFADTVNQREKLPFTVMAFTTLERLKTYAKEHAVDLLLISSAVPKEEGEAIGAGRDAGRRGYGAGRVGVSQHLQIPVQQ